MIPEEMISAWGLQAPWRDRTQVEQDLILHALILLIYSEKDLSERLAFRGGTCLNKLYWVTPFRYSEDLDFVQVHPEPIGRTITLLKQVLRTIFPEEPHWERKTRSFRLFCTYSPEGDPGKTQHVKIEINTREHFAVEGYRERPISLDSSWKSGEARVRTYSLEELLATKIRALYQRRKGRDLFDLWVSRKARVDYSKSAAIYLEYAEKDGKRVHRDMLVENLQAKLHDPAFMQDVIPLIRPGTDYSVIAAAEFVQDMILSHIPVSKAKRGRTSRKS